MVSALRWKASVRIIPSRYPYVGIYDRIADPADIEALVALEQLTNPRVRTELGNLALVRVEDRISGPGTTPVMAAFTNSGATRFGDGTFGIYYAAHSERTAIAETRYHRERFLRATSEPPIDLEMREYRAGIAGAFEDVRARSARSKIYARDDYSAGRAFGIERYRAGCDGIVFNSVRDPGGQCAAVFRPRLIANPHPVCYLLYRWDGASIVDVLRVESLTGKLPKKR